MRKVAREIVEKPMKVYKKRMNSKVTLLIVLGLLVFCIVGNTVFAEELVIQMNLVNEQGIGKGIGTITASDSKYGLLLVPQLKGLTPGIHGFHVHENADCGPATKDGKKVAALAAGGHFDPLKTGHHTGPYGDGHLGDLPALYVNKDGAATCPVLAPRLKTADLRGRSLIIHAEGDNYSDKPEKLGGGGARVACGVID